MRGSRRAVPIRDVERIHVARVVEMYELLQTLDIAVVKESLLEVRRRAGLGGGTLWRCHGHIACSRHLEFAVGSFRILCPTRVLLGRGNASKQTSQAQVSEAEGGG